jgi:hypothetical protein
MFFYWGGYKDCVDVNVQAPTAAMPLIANRYGLLPTDPKLPAAAKPFEKLNHCEFRYVQSLRVPCQVMTARSAQGCLDACAKDGGCTGVQAVRRTNVPGTLPRAVSLPTMAFQPLDVPNPSVADQLNYPCSGISIQSRSRCSSPNPQCVLPAGTADDAYICYGFNPFRDIGNQVEEDYSVSLDPTNPKFYSTCWVKVIPGGFLNIAPAVPQASAWRAGDKCVSCGFLHNATVVPLHIAPDWATGLTTPCLSCDAAEGHWN